MNARLKLAVFALGLALCPAWAEQFIKIGDFEAHYMILDTLSLEPDVAENYGIARARDQSILTLSVLDASGGAVDAKASGVAINLLGNRRKLDFQAIKEGDARYAIASIRHTEEKMRFEITIAIADGPTHEFKFEQKLYLGK